jgi:hypothetical protein
MTPHHPPARLLVALAALAAALGLAAPASAATPTAATPTAADSLTGYAFDRCATPDQASMDAWWRSSPFWGVGVYLGGENLHECDTSQLTSSWMSRQLGHGWRVLPIWVGPQASCTTYATRIDDDPTGTYAAARQQGREAADGAADQASSLGVPSGTALFYDLEDFDLQASDDCRRSALSFLSAWTDEVHARGFVSGVYANVAAGIAALDYADAASHGSYVMPDRIWYAWANGRADTAISTTWVRSSSWTPHRRLHQYAHEVRLTYGGVTMTVDRNYLDVGRGSVAPAPAPSCGVRVSFPAYATLRRGATGTHVEAAQCLLRQQRYYSGRITGRFDAATATATRRLRRGAGLGDSGVLDRRAWTALLSRGSHPLVKVGSASQAVRRLQRALNAARGDRLTVSGVFTAATTASVRRYQQQVGLPVDGVAGGAVWSALTRGRR